MGFDVLKRLRELMRQYGFTEYELHKRSGVPQSTINSLFRKNNLPTLPTLISLCEAFNISLADFFADGKPYCYLNIEQMELFDRFIRLTPEQKSLIIALVEELSQTNGK